MKKYSYLSNTPCEQALQLYKDELKKSGTTFKTEIIPVKHANNRVNVCAVYAKRCSPHYCSSAMDGIALSAGITAGASESTPVILSRDSFIRVDTGDPMPAGTDSVIMIENCIENDDGTIKLLSAAAPWQNVRQIGEDVSMGDMLIPSFTKITPAYIGALLAGGVTEIEAVKIPTAAIIPTGDEIIPAEKEPQGGEIPEFNSAIFSAMLENAGCHSIIYPIVPDNEEYIENAIKEASVECDAVIVIAGSSAGRDDYTSTAIENAGTLILHGSAIKPGKPVILGRIGSVPFIGVPGYPVSGITVIENFFLPMLQMLTKQSEEKPVELDAVLTKRLTSSLKYNEFIRARAGFVEGTAAAVPAERGAGIVSGFAKASGIINIPQNCEGYEAGDTVKMRLMKPMSEIENAVLVTGSHDPLIDEISDILRLESLNNTVISSHVGSMGAITAIKRKQAHLGGIHLLDTQTGEYNKSYVKKYFPDGGVTLIKCVNRVQGLMITRGNPKNIYNIIDLSRNDVSYVNRQRGSGTRILIDYLLEKNGINTENVYGYSREEFTHTAAAAIIAGGDADCGLGIYSAARLYNLDFVPLWNEEYDFLVSDEALELEQVKRFIIIISSSQFKDRLEKLGGYSINK